MGQPQPWNETVAPAGQAGRRPAVGWIATTLLYLASGALGGMALTSCASKGRAAEIEKDLAGPETWRLDLQAYCRWYMAQVEIAAARIIEESQVPSQRRNAVLWKIRTNEELRIAIRGSNQGVVLMNVGLLTIRSRNALEQEANRELFGEFTELVLQTCGRGADRLSKHALGFLSEEQLATAMERLEEHVAGGTIQFWSTASDEEAKTALMSDVLNMPLDAVRFSLSGVDPTVGLSDTAASIRYATKTVEAVRRDLEFLPANLRWQTELVMLGIEENRLAEDGLRSFAQLSESSERLTKVVEELPATLGDELNRTLVEVDGMQGGIQETLVNLRATLEEAEGTLATATATVDASDEAAQNVTLLSESLTVLVQEVDAFIGQFRESPDEEGETEEPPAVAPEDASEDAPGARPFDITEYTAAAVRLTEASESLRAVVAQVDDLLEPEQTEALGTSARSLVRGVLTEVVLGVFALLTVIALVLLGYRFGAARITRRPPGPGAAPGTVD